MTAAATPGTTVWVYRCSIYAYPWYTSVRTILDDPAYAAWFIDFKPEGPWRSPKCDNNFSPPKCSDHYHMQEQTPGFPHGDGDCTCPVLLGIVNRHALVSWLPVGNPIEMWDRIFHEPRLKLAEVVAYFDTVPPTAAVFGATSGAAPGCDCGKAPCGFYLWNHSSTAIVHGQTFQHWFIHDYMLNAVGMSPLVRHNYILHFGRESLSDSLSRPAGIVVRCVFWVVAVATAC